MTAAAPANQQMSFDISLYWGDTLGSQREVGAYTEPLAGAGGFVGNFCNIISVKLVESASETTLNLASYCSQVAAIVVLDRGGTGIKVGTATGATKFDVAPNKALAVGYNTGDTPPTLYFTNPSSTATAYVEVGIVGIV